MGSVFSMASGDREADELHETMSTMVDTVKGLPFVNQPLLLALIRALDEKVSLLINAQKDGVKTAMDAAEKAVAKAEAAADKRFEALNELRGMAADWRSEFARQSTVDLQFRSVEGRINILESAGYNREGNAKGRSELVAWIVMGLFAGAALTTVLGFVLHGLHP